MPKLPKQHTAGSNGPRAHVKQSMATKHKYFTSLREVCSIYLSPLH